ncbi:rod shape-determining protein MreC [soil metagenome]
MSALFYRGGLHGFRLIIFMALSIVLMTLDQHQQSFKKIRSALTVLITPIQYIVNSPVQFIDWLGGNFTAQQKLLTDNANLQAQNLLLKTRLQTFITLENENSQLRALLKSSSRTGVRVLIAQLLSVDLEPFIDQIVINKGTNDNVYIGQPVVDANGLMGQIIQVGQLTSRVLLVTDRRSAIPVQNNRNGIRGILVGRGSDKNLSLIHISRNADIRKDDILVTSGLGGYFPIGYPVGVVQSVTSQPGDEFVSIAVEPSAHLNRSRLVLLLWTTTEQPVQAVKKEETKIIDAPKNSKKSK